jgi:hypothetical protein
MGDVSLLLSYVRTPFKGFERLAKSG